MRTPFVYQQINDKRRHFLKSYNLLAIENRTGKLIFFSVHRTHVQPESNFGLRLPNFIVESSLLVTLFGCQATVCFNLHVYEAIYGKLSHEDFPERLYMFQDNIFWRSPLASHGSHPMFVRPSAEFVKNLPDLYFGFRNLLLFETLDIQVAMYLFDTRFLLMDCRLPRQKQYQHPKTTYALPPMLDFADVVFNIGPYVYSLKDEVIQTMRVKVSLESVIFLGKLDIQKRLDNVLLPLSSAFVMFGDLIFLSNAAFGSVKVADMVNERIVALEVSEPKSFGAWFYGCEPYFGNILARSTYRTDRFASGFHWQNINAGRPALFEDKIFEYIIWYGFFMYLLIDIIIYMLKRKYVRKRS